MKLITREQWEALPRKQGSTSIEPEGVCIHWEGGGWKWPWEHSTCYNKVRAMQIFHMNAKGWSDIAYNFLACPHGYVFEGRGINRRPSANGNVDSNSSYYAVQIMWGTKAEVTPVTNLLIAGRDAIDYLRLKGGAGKALKGHRDFKSTDCPGNILYAWVKAGCPRPGSIVPPIQPPVGDEMTPQQEARIMKAIDSNIKITVNVFELLAEFSRREWHDDQEMNAKIAELQKQVTEANRELDILTPNDPEPK